MKKFLASSLLLLAFASPGFASTLGVDFTSPGIVFGPSSWIMGFKFEARTAATIARLGVFDADQNGLSGTQQVGLWNSLGQLLASTLVDNSDSLEGYWRFRSITSVTLTIGEHYYVASQGGEAFTYQTNGFTVNPHITFLHDSFNSIGHSNHSPLGFPAGTSNISASQGGGFFGANLDFAPDPPVNVPEPASVILLGLGLAGLVARNAKRRE